MGVDPQESLIYKLFCHWFEGGWDIVDNKSEWNKMLCPFHGESRPSSSISYDNDAFTCRACEYTGDALKLIMIKEGCGFQDSKRYAEAILGKSYERISPKSRPKSSSPRVFGKARSDHPRKGTGSFTFPDWIR